MIKQHEFNKIGSWVAVQILLDADLKYFVTLTIKNSLLLRGKNTNYFEDLSNISNDRDEYLKILHDKEDSLIESCYLNKKSEKNDDIFKINSISLKKENIFFSYECLVKLLKK